MKTIAAGNFKTHCLSLLDQVAQSRESLVITKYGKPVAKIVPYNVKKDIKEKPLKGSVIYLGDLISPIEVDWEATQG